MCEPARGRPTYVSAGTMRTFATPGLWERITWSAPTSVMTSEDCCITAPNSCSVRVWVQVVAFRSCRLLAVRAAASELNTASAGANSSAAMPTFPTTTSPRVDIATVTGATNRALLLDDSSASSTIRGLVNSSLRSHWERMSASTASGGLVPSAAMILGPSASLTTKEDQASPSEVDDTATHTVASATACTSSAVGPVPVRPWSEPLDGRHLVLRPQTLVERRRQRSDAGEHQYEDRSRADRDRRDVVVVPGTHARRSTAPAARVKPPRALPAPLAPEAVATTTST